MRSRKKILERCSVVFLCACLPETFTKGLSVAFSLLFLVVKLASHVLFFVSKALALPTAYNIKHNAPWINQLGKGSSHDLVNQLDDFSSPD